MAVRCLGELRYAVRLADLTMECMNVSRNVYRLAESFSKNHMARAKSLENGPSYTRRPREIKSCRARH